MEYDITIKQYSEKSILVQFPEIIDSKLLGSLLNFKTILEKVLVKEIVEIIQSYNSLLIIYISTIEDFYSVKNQLLELVKDESDCVVQEKRLWKIPVCYGLDCDADVERILKRNSLSFEELISLHTAPTYQVFCIGFLPGFLYLGGLDKRLHFSRKDVPSRMIKKGSVAIGQTQTGIYPIDSPGGWTVVGKTPIGFFDINTEEFTRFSSGDNLQFTSIEEKEFNDISIRVKSNNYDLEWEVIQ